MEEVQSRRMIGIDTNVLLRLFTDDSPAQARAVARLLDQRGPGSMRVANIVLVELVWTLLRHYKRTKPDVINIVEQLLQREELVFESRGAVMIALHSFDNGKADFADYLIAMLNEEAGAAPTYTFDQYAGIHPSFALISP